MYVESVVCVYLKSAADAENKGALYMLGLCYRNGYGTEQDEEKGLEILK